MIVIFLQLAGYFLSQGFNATLQSKFPRCYFAGAITCILPKTIKMQEKIFGAIFVTSREEWDIQVSLSCMYKPVCCLWKLLNAARLQGLDVDFYMKDSGCIFCDIRVLECLVSVAYVSVEMGSNSRLPVHVPRSLFDILQLRSSQTSNERFVYQ